MLQDFLENGGKFSCLAQCYIYAVLDYMKLDERYRETTLLTTLLQAYNNGCGIDKEFFVSNPILLMETTFGAVFDKKVKIAVSKKDIMSFKDLPFGKYAAVRFDYNGHSHWVLSKDQKQIYNSLDNSNCVRYGKPTTARVIEINEG